MRKRKSEAAKSLAESHDNKTLRLTHLVEQSPAEAALVRAAKKWAKNSGSPRACVELRDAVEKLSTARTGR